MIGLDTNVLVRYLAQDDAVQSAMATELFKQRLTEQEPGFVSIVAMAETAWVLERKMRTNWRRPLNVCCCGRGGK
jgi:predicted nucleic-acid-binding protein